MGLTFTDILLLGAAKASDIDDVTFRIIKNQILQFGATGRAVEVIVKGVAPLSLPDAIANSLSYVKAFGGTEQRNLPDGYTQLEYIQSSGSQYIDTGRVPNNDDIIEQKFQKNGTDTATCAWYGSMPSSQTITPRIGIGSFSSQSVATIFAGTNYTGLIGTADTNVHTLRFQATGIQKLTYTLDGVTAVIDASTSLTPTDMYEPAIELTSYLFARHGTNGVQVYDNEGTKIYYHREYLANGTLMLDMVPVKRNSDNVLGMYDFVSGQFFTNAGTGTFAAGPTAVPTPDAPMDIVSNNGVLKLSSNLSQLTNIDVEGTAQTSILYGFDIGTPAEGDTYTIRFDYTENNVAYSETGNLVYIRTGYTDSTFLIAPTVTDASSASGTQIATIGTAGKTIQNVQLYKQTRFTSGTISLSNIQIEKGSYTAETIPLYHPYGTVYTDGTVETINAHGKNLFDSSLFDTDVGNTLTYVTYSIPNGTYTMSSPDYPQETTANVFVLPGEVTTGASTSNNGVWISRPRTITVTDGKYTIAYRNKVGGNQNDPADYNWQLESGSPATDYVPYFDGGTATAEMLLKVGDYQDVQSIIDGAITRNVGVKVLDGTEDWTKNATYPVFILGDVGSVSKQNAYCSHFKKISDGTTVGEIFNGEFKLHSSNGNTFYFGYGTTGTTLTQWQQYLADQYAAGTPVIVVYPLATPTTESVTGQTLQVTGGDNVLEITQASLNGLELEAEYQAAVSLTIQEVQDANLDPNVEVTIS